MTLAELKEILNSKKVVPNTPIIFVYPKDKFLVNQYIDAICENKKINRNKITKLSEIKNSSLALVFNYTSMLNILEAETLDANYILPTTDLASYENLIIICKKIDKKIEPQVKEYTVNIPEVVSWQIQDYVKQKYPGVEKSVVEKLCEAANNNIYRITAELDKVADFDTNTQNKLLEQIIVDPNQDLCHLDYFDLPNALVNCAHRNKKMQQQAVITLSTYLLHKNKFESEDVVSSFSLVAQLLNKYKNYLLLNSGISNETIGLSSAAAYKFMQVTDLSLTKEDIIDKISFLSSFDERLKAGLIDMPESQIIDYIICKVLE